MTEGLSPTIENSYVVFLNSSPKKIWNKAVGKRFISKIQIYFHEFSTESKFLAKPSAAESNVLKKALTLRLMPFIERSNLF